MKRNRILISTAYPIEISGGPLMQFPSGSIVVVYTDAGKLNSGLELQKALPDIDPFIVINIGSAGSLYYKLFEYVICTYFEDRDFRNCSRLATGGVNTYKEMYGDLEGICVSGDSLVLTHEELPNRVNTKKTVFDMEAYAQATVCKYYGVPFISIKIVTDIVGRNRENDWKNAVKDIRYTESLEKAVLELIKRLKLNEL